MTTPIPAGWKPIESAPKNQLVMVYTPPKPSDWPDTVRIGFDYIDPEVADDYWYNHGEHYEHYCCVAKPENCTGPQERAPYTHWMPLPAEPSKYAVDHDGMENEPMAIWAAEQRASAPSSPGDAQDEQPQRNGCGSVSFKLSDGSTVSCDWSAHEWELSIPATRHERDIAFKELLQEIGRLRALGAAPAAGDARAALEKVESLQRYGFGYADDGNGARYLSSLKRDDGAFLRRDEVLAAIAAQVPQQGEA